MTEDLIAEIVARWEDPAARPLFKGSLIDEDGCCCAQGDILRTYCGWDDAALRRDSIQAEADREVGKALGISLFQSVLLRVVNDRQDGCPQDVLRAPEKVLGDQAHILLAFGRHFDRMNKDQWDTARAAAWAAAGAAAWAAAGAADGAAAWDALAPTVAHLWQEARLLVIELCEMTDGTR